MAGGVGGWVELRTDQLFKHLLDLTENIYTLNRCLWCIQACTLEIIHINDFSRLQTSSSKPEVGGWILDPPDP